MKAKTKSNIQRWIEAGENRHKVNKKRWLKWEPLARRVFNDVFERMEAQSYINAAPDAPLLSEAHWAVIRWNTAFEAACGVHALTQFQFPTD